MRVIAGKYKGHCLATPAYQFIRPTTQKVKEAIFNILTNTWNDAIVLDLYAGTGNLGIEALSRGAKKVVFVDKSPLAIKIIKKNISKLGDVQVKIWRRDVLKGLNFLKETFSIIFIDPPYEEGYVEKTLTLIKKKTDILRKGGIIIIEHSPKEKFSFLGFNLFASRRYGQTQVTILKKEM
ncbi:MAG: 16S rRNA (guanine(966)-N(2))-methyltransferase RsmD [Candidatus Desulfofervidus auxilii]|nr:16S rRNA (guanine(966)-N(2))-methyltransferase RsmD [Candidatus Desulfofervidus auxilii]